MDGLQLITFSNTKAILNFLADLIVVNFIFDGF